MPLLMKEGTVSCDASSRVSQIGAIFRDFGPAFLTQNKLGSDQRKVFWRIAQCRTAALGGALWKCTHCHHWVEVYHSCRDRHCPHCQTQKRKEWVQKRLNELLPVPYYHLVFTLPHHLHKIIKANPKECLSLLFQSASQTLLSFANDPKYLGAKPGILMVLHTWGRKLNYHPHVHVIMTAGGLSKDGQSWVDPPSPKFLFPVKALSKVFRGKFLTGLDKIRSDLRFPQAIQTIADPSRWNRWKAKLATKAFLVYAKRPFGSPAVVLKYLGAYTHRVAISNQRILKYDRDSVTFRFKDYATHGVTRILTMTTQSFARAFLQHVLPKAFMRIRSYGFLASRTKTASLKQCRALLGDSDIPSLELESDPVELSEAKHCPRCHHETMVIEKTLHPIKKAKLRALLWDTS